MKKYKLINSENGKETKLMNAEDMMTIIYWMWQESAKEELVRLECVQEEDFQV